MKQLDKAVELINEAKAEIDKNNTGNWNTGHRNTGNLNTGNWNTGDTVRVLLTVGKRVSCEAGHRIFLANGLVASAVTLLTRALS